MSLSWCESDVFINPLNTKISCSKCVVTLLMWHSLLETAEHQLRCEMCPILIQTVLNSSVGFSRHLSYLSFSRYQSVWIILLILQLLLTLLQLQILYTRDTGNTSADMCEYCAKLLQWVSGDHHLWQWTLQPLVTAETQWCPGYHGLLVTVLRPVIGAETVCDGVRKRNIVFWSVSWYH